MTGETVTGYVSITTLIALVATSNIFQSAKADLVRNSESVTISLGDFDVGFDDLEMIPESKHHALVNQKLERFHNFVKKTKVIKHPWEKLFVKNTEYRKSERSYKKLIHDTITKMKDFHNRNRKKKLANGLDLIQLLKANVDKKQLSSAAGTKNDKDNGGGGGGDDDDDDDEEEKGEYPVSESGPEFEKEYETQIHKDEEKEKAFKYSDQGKPEESMHEAFEKIIDIKTPENCSNITGFGIQSVECIIKNYQSHEMTGKEAISKFIKIFLIWVDIYLTVAIPLWCIKGWGCCCITWEYCQPRRMVEEVQKYVAENPPGVYVNENGEEEHYAPSTKEKELYDKINKKILRM